jgi:CHAT domain-containing protein
MFLGAAVLAFAMQAQSSEALSPPEEAAALHFVQALTSSEIRTFIPFAADPDALAGDSWIGIRNFFGSYNCISVGSYRAWREADCLVIEVDGNGRLRNARHSPRPIPRLWYLRVDRAGGMTGAGSEADFAAEALVRAADDDARRAVLDRHDTIVPEIAHAISAQSARTDSARLSPAAMFLLERSQVSNDPVTETYAWCTLARLAFVRREWAEGTRLGEAARAASRRVDSCDLAAYADFVSATSGDESDYERQRILLEPLILQADVLEEPMPALRAINTRAGNAFYVTDYGTVYRYLQTLLELSIRYEWPEGELLARHGLARVKDALSENAEGIEAEMQVAKLAHRLMNREFEARACNIIGSLLMHGLNEPDVNPERGIPWFRRALAIVPKSLPLAEVYEINLGSALVGAGRLNEAEPLLQSSMKRGTTGSVINRLVFAEKLRHAQGRYSEAMDFARQGIAIGTSLYVIWELKADLGNLLIECGDVEAGIEALRESLDLIETRRALSTSNGMIRAGYFATRLWVYASLLDVLVDQHRFDEALAVAERMKARSLDDIYSDDNPRLALTDAEKKTQRELNQRIVDLNRTVITSQAPAEATARKQLRAARADLEQFNSELAVRHSQNVAVQAAGNSADPAASWHGAPVIEYVALPDSIVAFVVRDGKVHGRRLPARAAIARRAESLLRRIEQRNLAFDDDARKLYDALLAPLADLLPRGNALNIVPDDFLWRIPFEVLRTPAHQYAGEKYAISYAPSFTMLSLARNRRPSASPRFLLALGDPTLASSTTRKASTHRDLSLGPLPDAAREVRALAGLYGAAHSTVLTGAAATESRLKKLIGDYRIVHLAAHGIAEDAAPLYSAVVLATATGDPDDGLLEMREMSELHLHADLVVLSSCDTARGALYAGEGVIGMSWALLASGCPTTVVSQWKAPSRATSKLMIEFHRRLLAGDSKAEAMRRAKMSLMRQAGYKHPLYWAPFVIVGDGMSGLQMR